jgi:hypothetical protein
MNWLLTLGAFYGAWALWMLYEIGRAEYRENDDEEDDDDEPTKR